MEQPSCLFKTRIHIALSYFIIITSRARVIYQSCSVQSIKNTKPIKSEFANANLYWTSWSMHSVFSLKKPSHYRRARGSWGPGGNYRGTKLYSIRCRPLAAPEEIIPAADSASFAQTRSSLSCSPSTSITVYTTTITAREIY